MPTEREIKIQQEDKLFDILLILELLGDVKVKNLNSFLKMASEKAKSGMTADEIYAVKERVAQTIKSYN